MGRWRNWFEDIHVCRWHSKFDTVFVFSVEWMAPLLYSVACTALMAVLTVASPTTRADEMSVELRMPEVQPKLVGGITS